MNAKPAGSLRTSAPKAKVADFCAGEAFAPCGEPKLQPAKNFR
jgi:hypothetical protein